MRYKAKKYGVIAVAAGLLVAGQAQAFNFGNIMNPSRWFGGNRGYDRYDDYYGPGYGGYGPGYGGYGYPGYGGYGYPGYGVPATGYAAPTYSTPQTDSSAEAEEIQRLKERVRELERGTSPPATGYEGSGSYYPSQPAYGSGQSGSQVYQPYGGQSGTQTYQPTYGGQSGYKVK